MIPIFFFFRQSGKCLSVCHTIGGHFRDLALECGPVFGHFSKVAIPYVLRAYRFVIN